MLQTEMITYNVRERGRKHLGQNRNFDTVALAALINGPAVQERVKHGDMLGYFGHWPRIKLGMNPSEGGVIDGKVVSIPPALRTIELSADKDGNVSHRAEFLDTNEGRIAERMFQSKAGGFSSAIDAVPGTSPQVARDFWGFDYVFSPNYSTNRGHKVVLDGIGDGEEAAEFLALLDAAVGESTQAASIMTAMFDSLSRQHTQALEAMERLAHENDALIGRLASGNTRVLDSMGLLEDVRMAPIRGEPGADFERFRGADLSRLQAMPTASEPATPESNYILNRFGVKV